ncbi:MAG: hypothetical protein QOI51_456 [Nocardioidaceae bacterium]|nr:hypothetical protein [Nocardioidaceae bacterium]
MRARLLAIQHEEDCPPAWLGDWLAAAGVDVGVVRGDAGDKVPDVIDGFDGLLVLGGEMGAYDDDRCPWLVPTKRLIARTVASGAPFLGVCLGHQLAAVALGGTVGRNPRGTATGLTPVEVTEAGRADRLFGSVASGDRAVQWNEDIVTRLPPQSTALAKAPDRSVQAARFADLAWGVQFHPEASPEVFASWTVNGPKAAEPRPDGIDMSVVAADIRAARSQLRQAWRPLAERFAEIVIQAMSPRRIPAP